MKIRKGGTRPGVWCEPRRAERGGQSCAYEAPGMAHGDVDMSDVHGDSAAADGQSQPYQSSGLPVGAGRPGPRHLRTGMNTEAYEYIWYWQYEAADNQYDISYWVVVVYIGSY